MSRKTVADRKESLLMVYPKPFRVKLYLSFLQLQKCPNANDWFVEIAIRKFCQGEISAENQMGCFQALTSEEWKERSEERRSKGWRGGKGALL